MAVTNKKAAYAMLVIAAGLFVGVLGHLAMGQWAKQTKTDPIIGFGFDIRCIKEHWGANDQTNLEVVAACEKTSHGGRGVSKVMAKAFMGMLNAKPRAWLRPSSAHTKTDTIRMMSDKVEDQLTSLIAEQLGVDKEKVVPDASFTEDLGADSLDAVELIMAIEEAFDIEIPDDEAEKMTTPGDCVTAIKSKIK